MRIALLGATSFIGRSIMSTLIAQGHQVIAFSRQPTLVKRWFPVAESLHCDFCQPLDESYWQTHLKSIDVIINCIGVFQTQTEADMWQIHFQMPKEIYQIAVAMSIKKIIHISALGIDNLKTSYAESKLAIEQYLNELPIDSVILRPSFVYGPGSYGGSSFFRGICGLPGFLPLPNAGKQQLQPIHINDLCTSVIEFLALSGKHKIDIVGDEIITLKDLLNKIRNWLGFGKAINISIPITLLTIIAKVGDLSRNAFISSTGMKLLSVDNISTPENYQNYLKLISFKPMSFSQGLLTMPSQVQDRWHARLFFLRPLLRLSIAFIWIFTAIITLFLYPPEQSIALLMQCGLNKTFAPIMLYASAGVDFVLGSATLMNYKIRWVGFIQILLMLVYTAIITLKIPYFWLHPFGPISKNIPLLMATAIMMALESSR